MRPLSCATALVGACMLLHAAGAAQAARPNVVLLVTDDQGYGDLSCNGNPVLKTPNLDRLHDEGVHLEDFHVDPMCAPTRAALMTGRYSARTGVWSTLNGCYIPRRGERTMAQRFAEAGYATAMFGKWHLGDHYPYAPEYKGFQQVVRHGGGVVGEVPDYWNNAYFDDTYFKNGKPVAFKGYCTDVWFDECIGFIRASKGRPFFCYLATNAPHNPYRVPPRYIEPYQHAGLPGKLANFYGMIANIDENLGRLMDCLREEGLADDTIVVFLGDNGTSNGTGMKWDGEGFLLEGFNAGMRGCKTQVWEGGHRNACFIRWPGGGISGGRAVDGLAAHFDLLPTLADLCGLPLETEGLDGISLAPQLLGKVPRCPDRTLVVHNMQLMVPRKYKDFCVMEGRWRLASPGNEARVQLFDLQADPGQQHDVASRHPEVAGRLVQAYESWWKGMEPAFGDFSRQYVGAPAAPETQLDCHGWRTESREWSYSQVHVRQGIAVDDAWWPVEVERAGRYRIELRRWPREAGLPLCGGAPPVIRPGCEPMPEGRAYPIESARLAVGDFDGTVAVGPQDKAAVFEVPLAAGPCALRASFQMKDAPDISAYYIYLALVATEASE